MRILLINNAIGALIAGIAAAFVWTLPSPWQWAMLATLGVSMLGAQTLFIQALRARRCQLRRAVLLHDAGFAALYDMALFGDWPDAFSQLGIAIVLAGVMLSPGASGAFGRRAGPA